MTLPRMYADNILIRMDHHERKERRTPGGLIIPAQHEPTQVDGIWATVLAIGPGHHGLVRCENPDCKRIVHADGGTERSPIDVEVGDRVLADSKHSGDVFYVDGIEHRIVRYDELIAVGEEDDEAAE